MGFAYRLQTLEVEPQGVSKGGPAGDDPSVYLGSRTDLPGSDKAPPS